MNRTDLSTGEGIYEFVSYNIPSFWFISLNSFDFIFCYVTVTTIYSLHRENFPVEWPLNIAQIFLSRG